MKHRGKIFASILLGIMIVLPLSHAIWIVNGTEVCWEGSAQYALKICSDGEGNAIMVWQDYRGGSADIYAQKVNALGIIEWFPNGEEICGAGSAQVYPHICRDGNGNTTIAWLDLRLGTYEIYAQKINDSGEIQWTIDGVAACTIAGMTTPTENNLGICPDGSGGVIMAWRDFRDGPTSNIYAQRLDSNGNPLWGPNGTAICTEGDDQYRLAVCTDNNGGAIIVWTDVRNGTTSFDIYAQRLNGLGTPLWGGNNGTAIAVVNEWQLDPCICADGSGGAIIVWKDLRNTVDYDLYAQKMSNNGNPQWGGQGKPISATNGDQVNPKVITDNSGGAFFVWMDRRGGDADIYTQHVTADGTAQWGTNGKAVCTAIDDQGYPDICNDGTGNLIIAWADNRYGDDNIYAQQLDSSGSEIWASNGVLICDARYDQSDPVVVYDGTGGVFIAWEDERVDGSLDDIYVSRVVFSTVDTEGIPGFVLFYLSVSLLVVVYISIRKRTHRLTN